LCRITLTHGEYSHYLTTKAAQVLNGNMKQKKPHTDEGIIERAGSCYRDIMLLDRVPRIRQDFPPALLLPSCHEPQRPLPSHILGHSFQRDPIFTFTTYRKKPTKIARRWQCLSNKLETDTASPPLLPRNTVDQCY